MHRDFSFCFAAVRNDNVFLKTVDPSEMFKSGRGFPAISSYGSHLRVTILSANQQKAFDNDSQPIQRACFSSVSLVSDGNPWHPSRTSYEKWEWSGTVPKVPSTTVVMEML